MFEVIKMALIIAIIGAISSGVGGFFGAVVKINKKSILASLFELTAGIMTAIVCLDMLPESFEISNMMYTIVGVILGAGTVCLIEYIIEKCHRKNYNNYSIMSLSIMFSMALHNIIEGLAVGTSMIYSISLGTSVLISIFVHDIPEGMVVGVANKSVNMSFSKIIINSILVGMTVGIGALIGGIIGGISNEFVSLSLSFAAGAMLYIVACDLIPSAKDMSKSKFSSISYILGILLGALIIKI